jgi:hypothetical protein
MGGDISQTKSGISLAYVVSRVEQRQNGVYSIVPAPDSARR